MSAIPPSLSRLLALLRQPGRTLRRMEASQLLGRIPEALLQEIVPETTGARVTLPFRDLGVRGTMPYGERLCLAAIATALRPEVIFEIGTFDGTGTRLLAELAPGARVHTLDLGGEAPSEELAYDPAVRDRAFVGSSFRGTPEEGRITQHLGDSVRFDFSPWRGKVDLVIVDGGHGHATVLSDGRAALRMVRPGGVIVFDDCDGKFPGLVRALLELGVPLARIASTRLAVHRAPR